MCPLVVTEASFDKKWFVALRTRKQPLRIMSLCSLIPFDQFSANVTIVAVRHSYKGTFRLKDQYRTDWMIKTCTESLGKTTKRFQEMPPDIGDSCIGLQGKLLLDCHNSQAPNCIRHCCTLTQYCIQSGQYQPNFGILSSCIFRIGIVFSYNFQVQFKTHFQSAKLWHF